MLQYLIYSKKTKYYSFDLSNTFKKNFNIKSKSIYKPNMSTDI